MSVIDTRSRGFQCSSASRKFLKDAQAVAELMLTVVSVLFSEPKIPQRDRAADTLRRTDRFQCSSASRKFLKLPMSHPATYALPFQCSSASRKFLKSLSQTIRCIFDFVSVLFSEPKIPQMASRTLRALDCLGFSALQRAENSSNVIRALAAGDVQPVSVLFSEPKIPQTRWR